MMVFDTIADAFLQPVVVLLRRIHIHFRSYHSAALEGESGGDGSAVAAGSPVPPPSLLVPFNQMPPRRVGPGVVCHDGGAGPSRLMTALDLTHSVIKPSSISTSLSLSTYLRRCVCSTPLIAKRSQPHVDKSSQR